MKKIRFGCAIGLLVTATVALQKMNKNHLFESIEIQRYYAIDESRDCHLYYNKGKMLTVDDISDDFQFVAEGDTLGDDNYWEDVTFDKYYRVITKDGINYLVDVNDYSKIRLYGFKELGKPFYFKAYDGKYGGKDTEGNLDYSGYVLPYLDEDDKICLVDLDSFKPLLMGVSICEERYCTSEYLTDKSHIDLRNYLENRNDYFQFYDASCGGIDETGEFSGYAVYLAKDDNTYLVDLTDFNKVLAQDFKDVVYSISDDESIGLKFVTKDDITIQYIGGQIPIQKTNILTKKN